MKSATFLLTLFLIAGLFGFSINQIDITSCFINFDKALKLSMASPQRLPETAEKVRRLPTENGEVEVSRIDGYRILYNNKKNAPFVNLKVELSDPSSYGKDTINILKNLEYLNSHGTNMETKALVELNFNGYRFYGISRNSIETGSTLGSFVMFPGENLIVYVDFNNLKPEFRNFQNLDEYKSQRNLFLGEYANHLNRCSGK